MNIEHKIREFLRTQEEPVTAQQIGEAIGHENANSLGMILYKMANHNQGVGRMKIKEGKRLVYGYFSTDKDAPATSKTSETLNLSSKTVEKQESAQGQIKAADILSGPIAAQIPEIKPEPSTSQEAPITKKFYVMGHDDYPSLDDAVAAARDIAVKNPGETIEVWETAMLHRFRAKVEVEDIS